MESGAAQAAAPIEAADAHTFTTDVLVSPPSGEARRSVVALPTGDGDLRDAIDELRAHFGANDRGRFEVQKADLAGGRLATLVTRDDERDPIVIVTDGVGRLLWFKKRPTAGILPPVHHLAIAPRPDGGVALFGWVESLRTVAARMWADDSNPFGDFELFKPDACAALSAAYGAGFGWLVACAAHEGTRVQRMREDGVIVWGPRGAPLGGPSARGPAALAFDTLDSFRLIQCASAHGGPRLLAFRYDDQARDLSDTATDLGKCTENWGTRVDASQYLLDIR